MAEDGNVLHVWEAYRSRAQACVWTGWAVWPSVSLSDQPGLVSRYLAKRPDNDTLSQTESVFLQQYNNTRGDTNDNDCRDLVWYFPIRAVFLDMTRLLCEHMHAYGLEELLRESLDPQQCAQFWTFTDVSLSYLVLQAVQTVVSERRKLLQAPAGTPPAAPTLAAEALTWPPSPVPGATATMLTTPLETECLGLLWNVFADACHDLVGLCDANAACDETLAVMSVCRLTRFATMAPQTHPVIKAGLIEMLVPYTLLCKTLATRGDAPVGVLLTSRAYWAVWDGEISLDQEGMYTKHFAYTPRVTPQPPEDVTHVCRH
jgi:hypothetical protein